VREIVIVIADLFLAPLAAAAAPQPTPAFADIPGIQSAGRFGTRRALERGWREWLARTLERADLADVAPACIAAATLDALWPSAPAGGSCWIATPVHLSAGLTRVHLNHGGLLQLSAEELATLAFEFARTLGADGTTLTPLASGDLLLCTPAIAPLTTAEPARCAGGVVTEVLPPGPAAAALRRLMAEIEIWLHGQALNVARTRRGALPVTALWPWGADGRIVRPPPRVREVMPPVFGRDAWLEGLCHLEGKACRVLPAHLEEVLEAAPGPLVVLVTQVGGQLQDGAEETLAQSLARLDACFVSPAMQALHRGRLSGVTLILNDVHVRVGRASRFRLWRRQRAGLESFA
jgi:hypothetical protein